MISPTRSAPISGHACGWRFQPAVCASSMRRRRDGLESLLARNHPAWRRISSTRFSPSNSPCASPTGPPPARSAGPGGCRRTGRNASSGMPSPDRCPESRRRRDRLPTWPSPIPCSVCSRGRRQRQDHRRRPGGLPGHRGRLAGRLHGTDGILAEQHHRKLAAWLEPLGVSIAWLSGSLKGCQTSPAGPDGGGCPDRRRHPCPDPGCRGFRPPRIGHRG